MSAITGLCVLLLWRRKLYSFRPLVWTLMLAAPFPYIATIAGWMTAELGRQREGRSSRLKNGLFTGPHGLCASGLSQGRPHPCMNT